MFSDIERYYKWQKRQALKDRLIIIGLVFSGASVLTLSAALIGFNTRLEKVSRFGATAIAASLAGLGLIKSHSLVENASEFAASSATHDNLIAFKHAKFYEAATLEPESIEASPIAPAMTVQDAYSDLASKISNRLASYKCLLSYQGAIVGLQTIALKFLPSDGTKAGSVRQLSEEIQLISQSDVPPAISIRDGLVIVELPRPDREYVNFDRIITPGHRENSEPVKIAVGMTADRKLIELSPADPNSTNVLIAGCNGSGKSEFLKSAMASLVLRYSRARVRIVLIDPKLVTFAGPEWENIDHLWHPVVKDLETAFSVLDSLVEEMERRYKRLESAQCKDLEMFNAKHPDSIIPRIVIVIDELAELVIDKESKQAFEASVKRLGAKGRASGIHVWGATQYPVVNVVTGVIKANLQCRICLRVNTDIESKVALGLDRQNAQFLLGKGDLLYLNTGKTQRLQSLYLDEEFYKQSCERLGIVNANSLSGRSDRKVQNIVNFPTRPTGSHDDMVALFERALRLEIGDSVVASDLTVTDNYYPGDSLEPLPDIESPQKVTESPVTEFFPEVTEKALFNRMMTVDDGKSPPSEIIKKGLGCTKASGNRSYHDVGKKTFIYLIRKYGGDNLNQRFREFINNAEC